MWDRLFLAGWNRTADTWNKAKTICFFMFQSFFC